jgi:ubiquitin-protein ligase
MYVIGKIGLENMLPEEDYFARLAIEADEMKREQPSFEPQNGDVTRWKGFIIGTNLYEGGVFVFEIQIPREYPFKPPIVKAQTKIWHPNFFNDRVCIGILGKDWAPANNIVDVVESLRFLLSNPNPDDPLHSSAAKMMKVDMTNFQVKVKEWIENYAGWDQTSLFG